MLFGLYWGDVLMELVLVIVIGVLIVIGIYLLLCVCSFDVIFGMIFLFYVINLLIFVGGWVVLGKVLVLQEGVDSYLGNYIDLLLQVLVLIVIVIVFVMIVVSIVLVMCSCSDNYSDYVDVYELDDDFQDGSVLLCQGEDCV